MNERSPIVSEFETVDQGVAYTKCGGRASAAHRVADGREDVRQVEPEALKRDDTGDGDERGDEAVLDGGGAVFALQQLLQCRHRAPPSPGAMARGECFEGVNRAAEHRPGQVARSFFRLLDMHEMRAHSRSGDGGSRPRGKKGMREYGSVSIPQEAFIARCG